MKDDTICLFVLDDSLRRISLSLGELSVVDVTGFESEAMELQVAGEALVVEVVGK